MKQNQTAMSNFSSPMANSFSGNMGSGLSQVDMPETPEDLMVTDMPGEQTQGAAPHASEGDELMPTLSPFMGGEEGQMPFGNMVMLSFYLTALQEMSTDQANFEGLMADFISAGLSGPMGMLGLNDVTENMAYTDQGMDSVQPMGQNQTEVSNFSSLMANLFSGDMGNGLSQMAMNVTTQGGMPEAPENRMVIDMQVGQSQGTATHPFEGGELMPTPSAFMGGVNEGQTPFENMSMLSLYVTALQEMSTNQVDFEGLMANFISGGLSGSMDMQDPNGATQDMAYNYQGVGSVQLMGVATYDDMIPLDVI